MHFLFMRSNDPGSVNGALMRSDLNPVQTNIYFLFIKRKSLGNVNVALSQRAFATNACLK